jgi:hypothetical protein
VRYSGVPRVSWFLFPVVFCLALWAGTGIAGASSPSISSESVSGLTETNAVLEATVIPGYDEEWEEWEGEVKPGGAWVQFQLVADPAEYWPEVTCPERPPESDIQCLGPYGPPNWEEPLASIGRRPGDLPTERLLGSLEAKQVTLNLSSVGVSLEPGRTYHYRLIAAEAKQTMDTIEWHTPPVYGPDHTFTTPSAEEEPPSGEESPQAPAPQGVPAPLFVPPPAAVAPAPAPRYGCKARPKARSKFRIGVHCRRAVALRRVK